MVRFCEWKATEPSQFCYLSVPIYGDDLENFRRQAELHEEIKMCKIDSRDPQNRNVRSKEDSNYVHNAMAQQSQLLAQKNGKDKKDKKAAKERNKLKHACESDEDIDNEGDERRSS